jgi:hypothetical protein
MSVGISEHYGIIIRKDAVHRCRITFDALKEIMEADQWLDEDENLISAGPHFGREASNEFVKRLERRGLIYGEDFFDFDDTLPSWCTMYVKFTKD